MQNVNRYMPIDAVRICTANNTCMEARGKNARDLTIAVIVVLVVVALYYVSRIK